VIDNIIADLDSAAMYMDGARGRQPVEPVERFNTSIPVIYRGRESIGGLHSEFKPKSEKY
jgi:hypothetical protein